MGRNVYILNIAITSLKFSFNDIMYKQIDGVAMDSPLGPALANIFVGYHGEKLLNQNNETKIYLQCIDDTFALSEDQSYCDQFLTELNSQHQSPIFTYEKETDSKPPFLNVLVEKSDRQFLTSAHSPVSISVGNHLNLKAEKQI